MKKLLTGITAVGLTISLLPVFSAYEAHIINVTADIENALEASMYSIDFGTVFPQEKFDQTFTIGLSQSFIDSLKYDDVEYVLRQKPKCQLNEVGSQVVLPLPQFGQVTEEENIFVCKDEVNYDIMAFLCPYLSKAEVTTDGTAPNGENDMNVPELESGHIGSVYSFHGPILVASSDNEPAWDLQDTLTWQQWGRLAKSEQDIADEWNIDLKVPCFGQHCAQDWADFFLANGGSQNEHNADAAEDYIQPIENESELFGCDLWLEVRELSLNPTKGFLIVQKVVINDNGGVATADDFSYQLDANSPVQFPDDGGDLLLSEVELTLDPGQYDVTEPAVAGYDTTYENCSDIDLAAAEIETCIITNNDQPGTLIVKKVLINDDGGLLDDESDFSFEVNGGGAVPFEGDGQNDLTVDAGTYTVTEPPVPGYTTTYDNCTDIVIPNGGTATCTITNDDNEPVLACNAHIDLMLVLDRSGSIGADLPTLKTAAHAFVDTLSPSVAGAHIGQSSFASTGSLNQTLTSDEAAVHLAINGLVSSGQTDLEAGITLATTELGSGNDRTPDTDPDFPDVMVVITDGVPNVPASPPAPAGQAAADASAAADAARLAGIEVFVVGVGGSVDATYLTNEIADDASHYFSAADFDDLQTELQQIIACDDTLKVYNFVGVTIANDGTGGNPITFEHDSDLFPWTTISDVNSSTTPTNTEYTNISTDNNARWSEDPGGGDFQVKTFRFFLTENIADIDDVKILWKGQPNNAANAAMWLHETGTPDFVAANWDQQGASLAIPADSDRYIVRHLSSGFATYIDTTTGLLEIAISIDNDGEELRTDYIQVLVTSSP